jgi:MFS family permease
MDDTDSDAEERGALLPRQAAQPQQLPAAAAGAAKAPPPLRSPLPRLVMLTCFTTQLSLAVFVTLPFTTLVYMTEDLMPGANAESLSRYTGLLASLSNLGMFVTSIPWGLASDRLGRRPVLLTGSASAALSVFALGCCRSYGVACACRLLGGMANGTLGTMKAGAHGADAGVGAPRAGRRPPQSRAGRHRA